MNASIANALEGFLFKAFNPSGRASFREFWLIMPLVWAALAVFLVLDFQSFWGALKLRQVPSVNPLHYGFALLFLLTWPSRLSLTMRRLHDSGRSGRWALVPLLAVVVAVWFVLATTAAALTTGQASALSAAAFGPGLIGLVADGAWPFLFNLAALVDPAQILGTIGSIVTEISGALQVAEPQAIGADLGLAPPEIAPLLAVLAVLILVPVVLPLLWLAFLLLPGSREDNAFGDPSRVPERIVTGPARRIPHAARARLATPDIPRTEATALNRQRLLQQGAAAVSRSIRRRSG